MQSVSFRRGDVLRKKLVKDGKVLCVDFAGTLQASDIQKRTDLIPDALSGKHCYRAKVNVKDFDDKERAKKGLAPFDFSDEQAIKEALKTEFDIPLWILRFSGEDLKNIGKYNLPLIYQIKGCNFHSGRSGGGCTFCFVDDDSNSGSEKGGVYLSSENIIATFKNVHKARNINHIRISGGEPTLALDHILALLKRLDRLGQYVPVQLDSNLSTGSLIESWIEKGELPKNILKEIAEHDPKVLACFKGASAEDVRHNTHSDCSLLENFISLKKLTEAGLDVYPHIINPDPKEFREFLDALDGTFENVLLKLHIFRINVYEPIRDRIKLLAQKRKVDFESLLQRYTVEWEERYKAAEEILNDALNEKYRVNYKDIERPGIQLKVRR